MRVALVCDWLTTVGGAESVLLALHQMYPEAPIYTSKYTPKNIDWFQDAEIKTGFLQYFPNCLRRFIGPLRQFYFSHLDLSDYDLVISVTGAEAKAVKTWSGKHHCVHLCYCHVPTQYYWEMYDDYIKNPGFGILNPIARLGLKLLVRPLRKKDYQSAQRPDQFITISSYAADLIKKYYGRESVIINPPANLKKISTSKSEFSTAKDHKTRKNQTKNKTNYITTSRQVNWKRLDLCVKACLQTGDNLTLIGDGPEHNNLVQLARGADNIHFLPTMSQSQLGQYLLASDAFLFPSMEPFGLAPVEAMAMGLPVLAYKKGGALDFIKPGQNGIFFDQQTVSSLVKAMTEAKKIKWSPEKIRQSAMGYDQSVFKQKMQELINAKVR